MLSGSSQGPEPMRLADQTLWRWRCRAIQAQLEVETIEQGACSSASSGAVDWVCSGRDGLDLDSHRGRGWWRRSA